MRKRLRTCVVNRGFFEHSVKSLPRKLSKVSVNQAARKLGGKYLESRRIFLGVDGIIEYQVYEERTHGVNQLN